MEGLDGYLHLQGFQLEAGLFVLQAGELDLLLGLLQRVEVGLLLLLWLLLLLSLLTGWSGAGDALGADDLSDVVHRHIGQVSGGESALPGVLPNVAVHVLDVLRRLREGRGQRLRAAPPVEPPGDPVAPPRTRGLDPVGDGLLDQRGPVLPLLAPERSRIVALNQLLQLGLGQPRATDLLTKSRIRPRSRVGGQREPGLHLLGAAPGVAPPGDVVRRAAEPGRFGGRRAHRLS
ncbi:hypothetical protein ACIBL3_23140 [Kribbella sp. NPDC050124]|uniref:hypothetical protein n=1 Tax=Kribbella sp. NPDC050124 TaxID=3364114 RepID=UPI00378BBABD